MYALCLLSCVDGFGFGCAQTSPSSALVAVGIALVAACSGTIALMMQAFGRGRARAAGWAVTLSGSVLGAMLGIAVSRGLDGPDWLIAVLVGGGVALLLVMIRVYSRSVGSA